VPDGPTARAWASLRVHARRTGCALSEADAWIAATAVRWVLPLITHDRDFRSLRYPNLKSSATRRIDVARLDARPAGRLAARFTTADGSRGGHPRVEDVSHVSGAIRCADTTIYRRPAPRCRVALCQTRLALDARGHDHPAAVVLYAVDTAGKKGPARSHRAGVRGRATGVCHAMAMRGSNATSIRTGVPGDLVPANARPVTQDDRRDPGLVKRSGPPTRRCTNPRGTVAVAGRPSLGAHHASSVQASPRRSRG
jgi:hypothetical protein